MKKCSDCEAIFSDNYKECPSCKSENVRGYKTADDRHDEAKDEFMMKSFSPFAVCSDLDDYEEAQGEA